ncbi:hypothetical protein [Prosthecobacter sp.]|uniref:hypothetical protein n=1 Tax=Prosthecobacter sp. TaxID=1965333 RepID=UPI0037831DF5
MTHHNEPDLRDTVLQLLTTQGSSKLDECLSLLFQEAMENHPWVGVATAFNAINRMRLFSILFSNCCPSM